MRVELIEDVGRFVALRQEWNQLLEHSAADCLFLTWEWLSAWWKHLANGRKLSLLAVWDGDDLAGLAPFAVGPWRVTRLRLSSVLEFIGTGSVGSDYLDVIGRRSREQDVTEVLADYLARRGTILELAQVNSDSSMASAVAARLAAQDWTSAVMPTDVCPFVRLAEHSWESYLATLGPDHRYNIRRRLRNLANRFDVRVERATTDAERRTALAELVTLHHKRWQSRGGSTAFCTPAVLAFHEEASRLALERGWLRLFVLRLDGAPASAFYGFSYRRRFYFYQSGFEPELGRYSVGLVTTALAIKDAIDEGADEYDFLRGDEPYKFHWAQGVRKLRRLELYPPRLSGWLCLGAAETGRIARRVAQRVLPHVTVQPRV